MGTLNNKRISRPRTAWVALALSFAAVACGGDDSASNKDSGLIITLPDGGTHGSIDSGTGTLDSGFVATPDSGLDAGPVVTPPTTCVAKAGCTCTPTTSQEFLNSCTTATCYPFDNTARIPDFTGTVPPLQ